jgi:hypothetical protein
MIAGFSDTFQYEPGMAEGDLVMVHGRCTGWAQSRWSPSTSSELPMGELSSTGT